MGFFNRILEKLGFGQEAGEAQVSAGSGASASAGEAAAVSETPAPQVTNAISPVDVVAELEQRAAQNPQKLNWKTSIVDLLKLLELDSSLGARKELAAELGCPESVMTDSAQMNMWLHKTVLARLAANGGNVPQELLD